MAGPSFARAGRGTTSGRLSTASKKEQSGEKAAHGRETVVTATLAKTKMCVFFERGKCSSASCRYAHSAEELRTPPNLQKTKLCKAFLQGHCTDGENCIYAHGEADLRVTQGIYKTQMCNFYERGYCKKGERCNHAHGIQDMHPNIKPTAEAFVAMKAPGTSSAPPPPPLQERHALSAVPQSPMASAIGEKGLQSRQTPLPLSELLNDIAKSPARKALGHLSTPGGPGGMLGSTPGGMLGTPGKSPAEFAHSPVGPSPSPFNTPWHQSSYFQSSQDPVLDVFAEPRDLAASAVVAPYGGALGAAPLAPAPPLYGANPAAHGFDGFLSAPPLAYGVPPPPMQPPATAGTYGLPPPPLPGPWWGMMPQHHMQPHAHMPHHMPHHMPAPPAQPPQERFEVPVQERRTPPKNTSAPADLAPVNLTARLSSLDSAVHALAGEVAARAKDKKTHSI